MPCCHRRRRRSLLETCLHPPAAPSSCHSRTPELVVQLTHERTGWVALPPALCSRLFAARTATPLALELRPIRRRAGVALPSDTPCYASWVGDTCAAGCVGVPTAVARALGLQEGAAVAVRPLPDAPPAVSVTVEPASEDDWEIVQLNAGFIEETLLTQVGGVLRDCHAWLDILMPELRV